jgi:uncharacterized protein involved in outer membrane biogenesis
MARKGESVPSRDVGSRRVHRRYVRAAVLAAALLAAVIAFVPALRTVDLTPLRGRLASLVTAQAGRAFTVGRGPELRVSLLPVVVADDVALANAAWGSQPEMLRVKRVEVRVRLLPLLIGRIAVDRVTLTSPRLLLETGPEGRTNWPFPTTPAGRPAPSLLSRLRIGGVRITDGEVLSRDARSGRETRIEAPAITLAPGAATDGELSLAASLTVNGTPVRLSGTVGGADALAGTRPFPFNLKAEAAGGTASFAGSVARLHELEGLQASVALESSQPQVLARLLGVTLPDVSPVRVWAQVRGAGGTYTASDVRAEIGRSALSGTVSYAAGRPLPTLTADLAATRLDLPTLLGSEPPGSPAQGAQASKVFSTSPLSLAFLTAFDGTLDLRAATLVVGHGAEGSDAAVRATLREGQLDIRLLSLAFGGGRVSGQLRLAAGSPPAFSGELSGRSVAVTSLLGALGIRFPCSGGATELTASLRGGGRSLHEWAASLDGTVRVEVGKGRIATGELALGADVMSQVFAAINPFHKRETTTELRCAVLNVPVEHGTVRLDRRFGVETSQLDLMGAGTVDLGTEALDLEVRSRARQGLGVGLGSFAGAVTVRGTLSRPSLGLNPISTVATTATTVGAAAVTGGLSIVAKRIWERLFAKSPCATALREGPKVPGPPHGPGKKR